MKMEFTAKDIKLLKVMFTLLIVVLMARFLIFPAIERKQNLDFELDEAKIRQEEMQYRIDGIETSRAMVEKTRTELLDASADYYGLMEQQEIDELVTGLALKHELFPSRLDIGEFTDASLAPYLYSAGGLKGAAGIDSAETDVGAAGTTVGQSNVEEAAAEAAGQMESGASTTDTAGEQADAAVQTGSGAGDTGAARYIKSVDATITLLGEEEKVLALIDDVETNYPSVQIRSFDISRASYMDTSMELVEETQASLKLTVYMCSETEDDRE